MPGAPRPRRFAQALRAVGEPVFGRTAGDVSMGRLLAQLFEITALFDMRLRPELVLLQKTMVDGRRRRAPDRSRSTTSGPPPSRWCARWIAARTVARRAARDFAREAARRSARWRGSPSRRASSDSPSRRRPTLSPRPPRRRAGGHPAVWFCRRRGVSRAVVPAGRDLPPDRGALNGSPPPGAGSGVGGCRRQSRGQRTARPRGQSPGAPIPNPFPSRGRGSRRPSLSLSSDRFELRACSRVTCWSQ